MARRKFNEVDNPKGDVEYWVVVDEAESMPHYFTNRTDAKNYADHYGHTIIFKENFN